MSRKVMWILIILLVLSLFVIAPLILPGDNDYTDEAGYDDGGSEMDIDLYKSSKKKSFGSSARSVGGSGSFRSGK